MNNLMITETLRYWLAATYLAGLGPRTILKLIEILGDIQTVFSLTKNDCKDISLKPQQINSSEFS